MEFFVGANNGLIINCLDQLLKSHEDQKKVVDVFSNNHYPSKEEIEMLAAKLDLSTKQVLGIFHRKRKKLRRQELKSNNSRKTKVLLLIK